MDSIKPGKCRSLSIKISKQMKTITQEGWVCILDPQWRRNSTNIIANRPRYKIPHSLGHRLTTLLVTLFDCFLTCSSFPQQLSYFRTKISDLIFVIIPFYYCSFKPQISPTMKSISNLSNTIKILFYSQVHISDFRARLICIGDF